MQIEFLYFIALLDSLAVAVFCIPVRSPRSKRRVVLLAAANIVAWTASISLAPPSDGWLRVLCFSFVLGATVAAYYAGRILERRATIAHSGMAQLTAESFSQFSLREVFMLVLIVSLVAAVAARSRPFTTSAFFNSLATSNPFDAIDSRIELQASPNGNGVTDDRTMATLEFKSVELTPVTDVDTPSDAEEVTRELKKDIENRAKRSGCTISERFQSANDFTLDYEFGASQGHIWGLTMKGPRGLKLFLSVTEFRK
jgi:hypothetical protein